MPPLATILHVWAVWRVLTVADPPLDGFVPDGRPVPAPLLRIDCDDFPVQAIRRRRHAGKNAHALLARFDHRFVNQEELTAGVPAVVIEYQRRARRLVGIH